MTTTKGQLYFIALTTLERLEIQFVPNSIQMTRAGNFPEMQVVGRNIPTYQYVGGKKTVTLDLDFHSDTESREDVITKVSWLESLTASNGYESGPQKVKLVFGSIFRDEEWIVSSVNSDLSLFNKEKGFLPQQAYVKVTLLLDVENNLTWTDIRR